MSPIELSWTAKNQSSKKRHYNKLVECLWNNHFVRESFLFAKFYFINCVQQDNQYETRQGKQYKWNWTCEEQLILKFWCFSFLGPRGPLVLPSVGSFVRPVRPSRKKNLDHLYTGIYALGKPSIKKSAVFFNIVQKAFAPPPPPFVWTFVLFCRGGAGSENLI